MLVELTHPFIMRCKDKEELLKDVNKFNTFCSRLEKQIEKYFPFEGCAKVEVLNDKINKYKGDAFELFVEALIKLSPCDKRLALIKDYKVIEGQDIGVDGFGICGANKKPITVQCKYRQANASLTANKDHLSNFTASSVLHYKVDPNPEPDTLKCNMVIISSADNLNFFTDNEMFGNKVHFIGREEIRKFVDNNDNFWEYFNESWNKSLENLKVV